MQARKILRVLHQIHDKIIYAQMQAYKKQEKIKNKKMKKIEKNKKISKKVLTKRKLDDIISFADCTGEVSKWS